MAEANALPEQKMICFGCQRTMEPRTVSFTYLGYKFHTTLLQCPKCGQVFIPEALVKGKMAQVEMSLEDK